MLSQTLGFSEEEYIKYLQRYVDRVDAQVQNNEFELAADVLNEMVFDVIRRYLRGILHLESELEDTVSRVEEFGYRLRAIIKELSV